MRARDDGNCRCIPIYYANSAARMSVKSSGEGLLNRSCGQTSDEVALEAKEDQKRDREADK